jgi:hypothetical protein
MQNSFTAKALGNADELVKQRDDLMAKVSSLQRDLAGFADIKEHARTLEVLCVGLCISDFILFILCFDQNTVGREAYPLG